MEASLSLAEVSNCDGYVAAAAVDECRPCCYVAVMLLLLLLLPKCRVATAMLRRACSGDSKSSSTYDAATDVGSDAKSTGFDDDESDVGLIAVVPLVLTGADELGAIAPEPETLNVKLIFLDMDGPIAPWTPQGEHRWSVNESIVDEPYRSNVLALKEIIEICGGSDVVKIVLSSNWRTDSDRMPWLEAEFERFGFDLVGHTDCIAARPSVGPDVSRDMEIYRVLNSKVLGKGGPYQDEVSRISKFRAHSLPSNWNITAWISIDDLMLHAVPASTWDRIHRLACFIPLPEDTIQPSGWTIPPCGFRGELKEWMQHFGTNHFVHVSPTGGIAHTHGAVEKAVRLLKATAVHDDAMETCLATTACGAM